MRSLLCLIAILASSAAWAGAGTITTKDAAGVTRTFTIVTDGGGNFLASHVLCDQSAGATCASVGAAGSPSTNALTIQAVTLGHGTAANAIRVELPTDGTGLVSAAQSGTWNIGTVTTVTNLSQMNGAALLMGNGVTGTGSQRVTIASDNTAFAVNATLSAETTKVLGTVRTLGNIGAVIDFAGQNAASPANAWLTGCQFNTTPTTITTGNASPCQLDNAGNLLVNVKSATGVSSGTSTSGLTSSIISGRAENAEATAVTNGQNVFAAFDLVGKAITLPYSNPENFLTGVTAAITDTTSTSVLASAGASTRNYVTSCKATNSHATVGTFVKILDGTTIVDEGYAAPAGGGWSTSYPVPLRGTAATALNCQAVTTGANFICSCQGYKGI